MKQLPIWVLTEHYPTFYDVESQTVTEQTAKVYGAMRTLIDEYNAFAEEANKKLASFTEEETEAREAFEHHITKVMNEYMCSLDQHLKLNLDTTAAKYLNAAINEGRLTLAYNEETESLDLAIVEGA